MRKVAALFLIGLALSPTLSSEPIPFSVNTKKWSHVLDDHFISVNINPTDLLQGKVYGLTMNSTKSILKGLAPAYVRVGSPDTAKYTFKRNRYPSDMVKPEDEFTVTETHWMILNEVLKGAGLDVIVCLNAGHRIEGTKKWDSRNSLELISFSDSQGYNLTWQLGYEIQSGEELSGIQFGKDLNRLRTILNAFPRYQNAKLIGPDIRVIHKKEDVEFWNDVLLEAGPILDAITWHPRWPRPSKMKVSENSDLGYEFPVDHLEWDRTQLSKIIQRTIFKNPIWIGETKRESTGTFAEGLMWARRLILAAKLGIDVILKQPNLMDITHPKPEYWIALLHKRLLGKAVLETRSVNNYTDLSVISHCTQPYYWSDKPEKIKDGPITVYAVNMGGTEQKIQIKGTWTGKSQILFQYVLTSGSDPDSVFSQMTYLNGEPLMMTDDGMLPDIIPKIRKVERSLTMKLPPYSIGFWVVPEARVKICQGQPQNQPTIKLESLTPSISQKSQPTSIDDIENINQFIVEKLKNPESDTEEIPELQIEIGSSESVEKDVNITPKDNALPRVARKIRQVKPQTTAQKGISDHVEHLKAIMQETQNLLAQPESLRNLNVQMKTPKGVPAMEQRIYSIAEGISDAMKTTNQQHEFDKFLEHAGLKQDFGNLLIADRKQNAPRLNQAYIPATETSPTIRLRRSIQHEDESGESEEDEMEESDEDETAKKINKSSKFHKKLSLMKAPEEDEGKHKKQDLIIPHQPDLKGLEERYKNILQIKIQDSKRKIDDIKKKIKKDETEINQKLLQPETVNDLQEEIIKKEIELLSKTEETVADILNSQKKRQETLEDIIFDELNDAKDERMNALSEIQKINKKKENHIIKRQAQQTPLSKPLIKTVEYIEKNFNLEPESVRKIKRSLEERMGEILRNYDNKKSAEVRKTQRLIPQKEERKYVRKPVREETVETRGERRTESIGMGKDKLKEKNYVRKSPSHVQKNQEAIRTPRKYYSHQENSGEEVYSEMKPRESVYKSRAAESSTKSKKPAEAQIRSRKPEEVPVKSKRLEDAVVKVRRPEEMPLRARRLEDISIAPKKSEVAKRLEEMENDSFELFNKEKFEIPKHKSESRSKDEPVERTVKFSRKVPMDNGKSSRVSNVESRDNEPRKSSRIIRKNYEETRSHPRQEEEEEEVETFEESEENVEIEKPVETVPLKHDKQRRQNMLKQITSLVDNLHSMEKESGRLKRMNFDEDISDEFEPDRGTRSITRIPRSAEMTDSMQKEETEWKETSVPEEMKGRKNEEVIQVGQPAQIVEITESPVLTTEMPATTQPSKLSKLRKLRKRPSRRLKQTVAEGDEPSQKKRHLIAPERPILEMEKRKLSKPKLRKINAKIARIGNDLYNDKEPETQTGAKDITQMVPVVQKTVESTRQGIPEVPASLVADRNRELVRDLQEMIKEEHFLGQGSGSTGDNSKTSGKGFSTESRTSSSEHTATPTEGHIIVDPTTENETLLKKTKKTESERSDHPDENSTERTTKAHPMEGPPKAPEHSLLQRSHEATEVPSLSEQGSKVDQGPQKEALPSTAKGNDEKDADSSASSEANLRKRRATFLNNAKGAPEEEDEDYSSEERIKKFKQMIYKKKPIKNDIRPFGGGLGADEFLRMARSTVRVVFDDVIPEAYGQTKSKIQNMGLSEYIKEFGKLVQQMRNLDQIFLNIGEAAVKGYIRGNRAEKGPYIQVISRKKRETGEDTGGSEWNDNMEATQVPTEAGDETIAEDSVSAATSELSPGGSLYPQLFRPSSGITEDGSFDGNEYARTKTDEEVSVPWVVNQNGQQHQENIQGRVPEAGYAMETTPEEMEAPDSPMVLAKGQGDSSNGHERDKSQRPADKIKIDDGRNLKVPKAEDKPKATDTNTFKQLTAEVNGFLNSYIKEDLKENITPWIKTTKDFIQQALTTLQRQRQISEILAKEGVSLLKMDSKKNVGKRAILTGEPMLPVYHMTRPFPLAKREARKQSDESLIRQLRGLQPGVYVVPTEDMTNVRSEQITNEAKQKTGMPNVVTLNIYYDKKNQEAGEKAQEADAEPRISQDMVTYYQNKAWNSVTGHYDQNNQFVSSMPPQEVPLNGPIVAPVQVTPVYSPDPRIAELPNSRLIQYPSPAFQYPPQKIVPAVVQAPQPVYNPVLYVTQPETSFVPQPPATKRHWRDFKVPGSGSISQSYNNGWNVHYGPMPGGARKVAKGKLASSYNNNYRIFNDKKRSIGDFKVHPTWSESALPFWKFFATESAEDEAERVEESQEKQEVEETTSSEDLFAENRKRAKEALLKASKESSGETKAEAPKKSQSRKKRSLQYVPEREASDLEPDRKLSKRSYGYDVDFRNHDILPDWFGAYQEIDNDLRDLAPHIRRSQIMSTPWSEEEELLSTILDADDELALLNMNADDYYYVTDNSYPRLTRHPRSTDVADRPVLKTNMIDKADGDGDLGKNKMLGKTAMKKLADENSSLELIMKPKGVEIKIGPVTSPKPAETKSSTTPPQAQPETKTQSPITAQTLRLMSQQIQDSLNAAKSVSPVSFRPILAGNGSVLLPQTGNDDAFYYFFKYAYDSFVRVMKSMTGLF